MLVGLKVLYWRGNKFLSPTMRTAWNGCTMRVEDWDDTEALRGRCGIHAAWPSQSGKEIATELEGYLTRRINFISGDWYARGQIIAELVGWGQCITGDLGWRAEIAMIKKVFVIDKSLIPRIQEAYPEIEVFHASQFGRS